MANFETSEILGWFGAALMALITTIYTLVTILKKKKSANNNESEDETKDKELIKELKELYRAILSNQSELEALSKKNNQKCKELKELREHISELDSSVKNFRHATELYRVDESNKHEKMLGALEKLLDINEEQTRIIEKQTGLVEKQTNLIELMHMQARWMKDFVTKDND